MNTFSLTTMNITVITCGYIFCPGSCKASHRCVYCFGALDIIYDKLNADLLIPPQVSYMYILKPSF